MRKHIIVTSALAAVALAATTMPAFTADNGTVALTITAQAPAAPCLTVSPETFDLGTKPFSSPTQQSSGLVNLTLTNCGTANQHVTAAGTNASGAGGSWALTPPADPSTPGSICSAGPDKYRLLVLGPIGGTPSAIRNYLGLAPAELADPSGVPYSFAPAPSGATGIGVFLEMPCAGSNGGTKTLSATFTAVIA